MNEIKYRIPSNEEIVKMDFYDFCGVGSIGMSDEEKIKWYRQYSGIDEEIAKELMDSIAHCNGWVNRWNPMKYSKYWIKKFSEVGGNFFNKHPHLLNFDNIGMLCDGEVSEVEEKFGKLEGYKELNKALNGYFNRGRQ